MPQRLEGSVKEAIISASQDMRGSGLSPGRSGNISVRWKDGMLITASGVHPEKMDANADAVFVNVRGEWPAASKAPSSEWRFHKAIYETRSDIGGVVHCHSRFATALACTHTPIPAFHYMVAKAGGGDIPVVPYATYGTPELAASVAEALKARNACLLANHGQIAIGETLQDALELSEEVETLAAQYAAARSIATPVLLEEDEMARVVEKFKTYGKAANPTRKRRRKTAP